METFIIEKVFTHIFGPFGGFVLALVLALFFIRLHLKSTDKRLGDYQKQIDNCHRSHTETRNDMMKLRESYGELKGKIEQIEKVNPVFVRIERALMRLEMPED